MKVQKLDQTKNHGSRLRQPFVTGLILSLVFGWMLSPQASLSAASQAAEPVFPQWEAGVAAPALEQPPFLPPGDPFKDIEGVTSPPLPGDCSELAPPGEPPAACVYGYVYVDGSPAAGVSVTLIGENGSKVVTTGYGPSSPDPYFAAALSEAPIFARLGELILARAEPEGEANGTTFAASVGSQQVDIWFSSACGPTLVGGVIAVNFIFYRACSPYIVTDNLLVWENTTLLIEPGTNLRFNSGKSLRVDGELLAFGMPNALIRMTSNLGTTPGDWGYVLFGPTSKKALYDENGYYVSGSIMQYNLIEYAGGTSDSDKAALRLDGAAPFFPHLYLRYSAGDGARMYNGAMLSATGGEIYDNAGWGVFNRSTTLQFLVAYSKITVNANGGIYSSGSAQAWILNNLIANNPKNYAIDIRNGSSEIGNNLILGNYGGIYSSRNMDLSNNIIRGNTGNGGVRTSGGALVMSYNYVLENSANTTNGGGIYLYSGSGFVNHNIFAGNQAKNGGGIYVYNNNFSVRNNAILNNQSTEQGAGLYIRSSYTSVVDNTILNNQAGSGMGGFYVDNDPAFNHNNLYDNGDYDLYNGNLASDGDFNAEYNFWGTLSAAEILGNIFDYLDNSSLSMVDFIPALALVNISAPMSPPTGLSAEVIGNNIALNWMENPESDVAGYAIYYDSDAPGFPYTGVGANEGPSPVVIGDMQNFTLTGMPPGIYYISLTAYDYDLDGSHDQTEGHESWFGDEAEAPVGDIPYADFSAAPTAGIRPLQVNFTNLSSGTINNCTWSFGDGGTSNNCANPSHTYTTAGTYDVSLSVSGPGGSDSISRTGYISVFPVPVSANFSGTPTGGIRPLQVSFTNLASGDYTTCSWNFGDGAKSTSCGNPGHRYNNAGTYSVSLAINGPGGSDTFERPDYIDVLPIPVQAKFSAAPTSGWLPLEVHFSNQSLGDYSTCLWDFDDGGTSDNCTNPSHTYQAAGVYSPSLAVSGAGGTHVKTIPDLISVWLEHLTYLPRLSK